MTEESRIDLDQQRIRATIKACTLFRHFSEESVLAATPGIKTVLGGATLLLEPPQSNLLHGTAPARGALFVVVAGRARLTLQVGDQRTIVATLRPGDVFGETVLFARRAIGIYAIDPLSFFTVPGEFVFRHFFDLGNPLLELTAARLHSAYEMLAERASFDAPTRLIRCLRYLGQSEGTKVPEGWAVRNLKLQDIADMIGVCRETASREFTTLREKGLVIRQKGATLLVTHQLCIMAKA